MRTHDTHMTHATHDTRTRAHAHMTHTRTRTRTPVPLAAIGTRSCTAVPLGACLGRYALELYFASPDDSSSHDWRAERCGVAG